MSRGGLNYEGIAAEYATFQADGSISAVALASGYSYLVNRAVTIAAANTVGYGAAGNLLLGRIDKYEADHYVTVQYKGFGTIQGVSAGLPSAGLALVVNGSGAVTASALAGATAKCISYDNTASVNTVMVLIG